MNTRSKADLEKIAQDLLQHMKSVGKAQEKKLFGNTPNSNKLLKKPYKEKVLYILFQKTAYLLYSILHLSSFSTPLLSQDYLLRGLIETMADYKYLNDKGSEKVHKAFLRTIKYHEGLTDTFPSINLKEINKNKIRWCKDTTIEDRVKKIDADSYYHNVYEYLCSIVHTSPAQFIREFKIGHKNAEIFNLYHAINISIFVSGFFTYEYQKERIEKVDELYEKFTKK